MSTHNISQYHNTSIKKQLYDERRQVINLGLLCIRLGTIKDMEVSEDSE